MHTLSNERLSDGNIVMTQQQGRDDVMSAPSLIQVPIGDSGEHVSIDPHNLSQTNVEDILGVLQSELAPLRVWLECAKAYLAEDNEEAFLEIVGSGCSQGERVFIINSSFFVFFVFFVFDFRRVAIRCRSIVFPQPLLTLLFSRSLSLSSNNNNINNRNRTVLPERRVRSRETFVLFGRAPGECCRTITIRRRRKRRGASDDEYAKTSGTFNASG